MGISGKVAPLEKTELKSSNENGYIDDDIIARKIESFLEENLNRAVNERKLTKACI